MGKSFDSVSFDIDPMPVFLTQFEVDEPSPAAQEQNYDLGRAWA